MNTITFDDNIVVMKLKDFKNASDSRNRFYKCWRAKKEECENLQSKIDKAIELIDKKISTETYQHLKKFYDDIDSVEEVWKDYEFEDLRDVLKEDK